MKAESPRPVSFPSRIHDDWRVPGDEECFALWDRYAMPDHIREHSLLVAHVATWIARRVCDEDSGLCTQTIRASALLHDIAKNYCIKWGGHHGQIGAAWVCERTGNPFIAQGIIHHVYWPFDLDVRRFFIPLCVAYGDKRVRHDDLVTLDDRFEDLRDRYGHTPQILEKIERTQDQSMELERNLSELIEEDLHACTFD
jgi:hypothetical protein